MQRETPHRGTEKMYRRGAHHIIMEAMTEAMPTQSKKVVGATRGWKRQGRVSP